MGSGKQGPSPPQSDTSGPSATEDKKSFQFISDQQDERMDENRLSGFEEGRESDIVPSGAPAPTLPPIEGREAWLNVLGSFLTHFVAFGLVYSFSLYVRDYQALFEASRGTISIIFQLQLGLMFAFGFFTGKLTDRLGVTRIYVVGILFLSVGLLLASFAEEFWQAALTHGLMVGIGCGCCYWPAVTVVPMWFDKRRGLALGLAVLGSGVGNFVLGIAVERLLTSQGFRTTLRLQALWSFVLLVAASFMLKRRLPRIQRPFCSSDRDILLDSRFIVLSLSALLFQTGYNIPFGNLGAYVLDVGLSSSFSGLAVGMIGVGSALGRILLGAAADRFGRLRCFKISIWGTSIFCAVWAACKTEASVIIFALFFGFFSGGMISLVPVVMGEFFGVERLATVMGYVSLALVPGSFLGPYIAGSLYDSSGSYTNTIIFCACISFGAALVLLFVKDKQSASEMSSQSGGSQSSRSKKDIEAV